MVIIGKQTQFRVNDYLINIVVQIYNTTENEKNKFRGFEDGDFWTQIRTKNDKLKSVEN